MEFGDRLLVSVRRSPAVREYMLHHREEPRLETATKGGGPRSGIRIVRYQPMAGVIVSQGTDKKLLADQGEVFFHREHLCLRM